MPIRAISVLMPLMLVSAETQEPHVAEAFAGRLFETPAPWRVRRRSAGGPGRPLLRYPSGHLRGRVSTFHNVASVVNPCEGQDRHAGAEVDAPRARSAPMARGFRSRPLGTVNGKHVIPDTRHPGARKGDRGFSADFRECHAPVFSSVRLILQAAAGTGGHEMRALCRISDLDGGAPPMRGLLP